MCGINGAVDVGGVTRQTIVNMNRALSHRGPDGEGVFVEGKVGLGHRRLSIIDLEGGAQPIVDKESDLAIVFNGEIYNYRELRQQLEPDTSFQTQSDTEVVLKLYESEGPSMLSRLRGMFAMAIWNSKTSELFIARDHLGQKPMYYAQAGDWFGFASEIKALLAVRPEFRTMDPLALHEYLTLRIVTPPRSMFQGIRKLPPGHYGIYRDGHLQIERYWRLSFRPNLSGNAESLCDELDQRIQQAVACNMVSDVPVGAFLSGGLDSSIVVAMMRRMGDDPLPTFSGEVPYRDYSELPYARLVSEQFSTDAHEITIEPSLVRSLPDLVWHMDEPSDPLSTCMYAIAELAAKHVKVVLGGDGGDELFGGYDRYFGNQAASWYAMLPEVLRRKFTSQLLKLIPAGGWYRSTGHQLHWMHQMSFFKDGIRYGKSLSYFYCSDRYREQLYTEQFARDAAVFDPEANIAAYFDDADADELVDRMLYADSCTRMPDHPVVILDRMCMAHGLEARSPFMDHELAEFCARLPSNMKVRGKQLRYLQMILAKRLLPEQLTRRKKQGFSSPLPYLLADEFRRLYDQMLGDSRLISENYLNREAVDSLVADHLSGRADHGQRLWQLVNAEAWYRMHIEGTGREQLRESLAA